MKIRGIRGVNGVPGVQGVRHVSPDDDDIEQEECVDCGDEVDAYALDDQGRCEDCQVDHVWDGLYRLQEQAEQQKRAGLREG